MKQFSLDAFLGGKPFANDNKGKKPTKKKVVNDSSEDSKMEDQKEDSKKDYLSFDDLSQGESGKDINMKDKKGKGKGTKKAKGKGTKKVKPIGQEKRKMDSSNPESDSEEKSIGAVNKTPSDPVTGKIISLPFMDLVSVLLKVEGCKGENSKDAIKTLFADFFIKTINECPEDLTRSYYFLLSKIGPTYRSKEFGIGSGILEKIVSKVTGIPPKQIKEKMKELGDLALVAVEGKKTVQTMDKFTGFLQIKTEVKPLLIKDVLDAYKEVASKTGKSSQDEKIKTLCGLMFKANSDELKFLVRSLEGGLKIGASVKTIVNSLARSVCKIYKGKKNYDEKIIYQVLMASMYQLTDEDIVFRHFNEIIRNKSDMNALSAMCHITPGIPVNPQLARATTGINVIFKRFENIPFTCEYKYDGFRGQIHYHNEKTEVFSRNLENMTETYPDIVEYIKNFIEESKVKNTERPITSFIIDCEMVAYDRIKNKILPFQTLTNRQRKNVDASKITIHVCMFCFDILYLNEEDLTGLTLSERRKRLYATFTENEYIQFAKNLNSEDQTEIENFMNDSIAAGCEGLIVKAVEKKSEYMAGQRNFSWLKLKKDYLDTSLGDSIDLVVIGAQYGKGKRCGYYGSYLLACYNDDAETYESVTMTGAGLKDEDLQKNFNELQPHVVKQIPNNYRIGDLTPDVYFKPIMVWEIKTADLTQSPIYTAGKDITEDGRGISLRFPRFIRTRPDKKPSEACTSEEIVKLYKHQVSIANNKGSELSFDESDLY